MHIIIKRIVEQVFDDTPSVIEEIKGKGKNNLVFKIVVNNKSLILRLNNREETFQLYTKEKWCSEVVMNVGIPTPKILEIGVFDGYAYSFQEYIEGTQGNEAPEKFPKIWFTLGQYAHSINSIPALDLKINYEKFIEDLFTDNFFVTRNIFSREVSLKIKNRLKETIGWEFSPTLCHGNLHPTNVIINRSEKIYIIDWETATGNRAPHAELAEIYTWKTGKENIKHFLDGYGLRENDINNAMRDIQTLILLRLVHVIVRKMPKDNDWTQDSYIKEMSKMLGEISDYEQDVLFTKNL